MDFSDYSKEALESMADAYVMNNLLVVEELKKNTYPVEALSYFLLLNNTNLQNVLQALKDK